jgi:hypothetical protein
VSPRASNAATSLAKQQGKEPLYRESNTTMSSFLDSVVPNKNLQLKSQLMSPTTFKTRKDSRMTPTVYNNSALPECFTVKRNREEL